MSNFRFLVRLAIGSLCLLGPLLIGPSNLLAMEPGTPRKLAALKLMVVSLTGLLLIVLALWSEYTTRRVVRWEDEPRNGTESS